MSAPPAQRRWKLKEEWGLEHTEKQSLIFVVCKKKNVQVISVYNTMTEMSNDSIKRRYTVTMSEKGER